MDFTHGFFGVTYFEYILHPRFPSSDGSYQKCIFGAVDTENRNRDRSNLKLQQ